MSRNQIPVHMPMIMYHQFLGNTHGSLLLANNRLFYSWFLCSIVHSLNQYIVYYLLPLHKFRQEHLTLIYTKSLYSPVHFNSKLFWNWSFKLNTYSECINAQTIRQIDYIQANSCHYNTDLILYIQYISLNINIMASEEIAGLMVPLHESTNTCGKVIMSACMTCKKLTIELKAGKDRSSSCFH